MTASSFSIFLILVTITLCIAYIMQVIGKGLKDLRQEAAKTAEVAVGIVKTILNLTPEVSMGTSVTAQKTMNILEVAFISKEFPIDYVFENKLLRSTKKLTLRGQYTVKAGFNLDGRFTLEIDETCKRIHANFPGSRILSVQQNSYEVISDDGYWNKLNQKDQELAVNEMNRRAEAAALEMQVCEEAKASLCRQLLDLTRTTGQEWRITFRDEPLLDSQGSSGGKLANARNNRGRFSPPPFNSN